LPSLSLVNDPVLTAHEAAAYLGVSDRAFSDLLLGGQVPHNHDGRRRTFTMTQLDAYLETARIRPGRLAHLTGASLHGHRYRRG